MKWRKITEDEVKKAILNPSDKTTSVRNRVNLWGPEGRNRLKVTVSDYADKIVVVTVVRKELQK